MNTRADYFTNSIFKCTVIFKAIQCFDDILLTKVKILINKPVYESLMLFVGFYIIGNALPLLQNNTKNLLPPYPKFYNLQRR